MKRISLWSVALLAGVLVWASAAAATPVTTWGAGALLKSSGACTRSTVDGTNFPATAIKCANTGAPEFYWYVTFPADAGNAWTPTYLFYSDDATAAKAFCFNVSLTAMLDGNAESGPLDSTPTFETNDQSTTLKAWVYEVGSAISVAKSTGGVATANCSGTECRGKWVVIRVARDNTGSCTVNPTADWYGINVLWNN